MKLFNNLFIVVLLWATLELSTGAKRIYSIGRSGIGIDPVQQVAPLPPRPEAPSNEVRERKRKRETTTTTATTPTSMPATDAIPGFQLTTFPDRKAREPMVHDRSLSVIGIHFSAVQPDTEVRSKHPILENPDSPTTHSSANKSLRLLISVYDQKLCGYPLYYNAKECKALAMDNTLLSECENKGGMVAFGSTVVLLAVFIVLGNMLLPIAVFRQPNLRNHHTYIKVSLCFADMIMGFILLFSVLPNMFWFRNSTEEKVIDAITTSPANATAIVGGSLLTTTAQASLMHLTFLSIERFVAIKWPMWYRGRRAKTIVYTLAAVWGCSLLFAFIPAAFPDKFEFTFLPVVFLYMLAAKELPDGSYGYHGPLYAGITMLLPYTIMVIFSLLTGVTAWKKLKFYRENKSTDLCRTNRADPGTGANRLRPDLRVFQTVLIVIVAFSLTLLPVVIIFILYNLGYYNCDTYAFPYTVSFYFCIANSFVNVLVYSARDKRFRSFITSAFRLKNIPSATPKDGEANQAFSGSTNVFFG